MTNDESRMTGGQPENNVPVRDLFLMLVYAYDLEPAWGKKLVDCQSPAELVNGLAEILARWVLARRRQGFHRAYISRKELLACGRGQIDLRRLRKKPWDPSLECEFEEHLVDVADNQILAWTLWRIARSGRTSEQSRPVVGKAFRTLQSIVTLKPFRPQACLNRRYHRLNQDYRPVHNLCRFFLEHNHFGGNSEQPDTALWLDLPQIYPQFLAGWLVKHLPSPWLIAGRVTDGHLSGEDTLTFPSTGLALVIEANGDRRALVLQYKVAWPLPEGIIAWAKKSACSTLYVVGAALPAQAIDASSHGLRVHALSFSLAGNLEQAGQRLLPEILAPGKPSAN